MRSFFSPAPFPGATREALPKVLDAKNAPRMAMLLAVRVFPPVLKVAAEQFSPRPVAAGPLERPRRRRTYRKNSTLGVPQSGGKSRAGGNRRCPQIPGLDANAVPPSPFPPRFRFVNGNVLSAPHRAFATAKCNPREARRARPALLPDNTAQCFSEAPGESLCA